MVKYRNLQLIYDYDHGATCLGWYMRHDEWDKAGPVQVGVDTPCEGGPNQTEESALAEAVEWYGVPAEKIAVIP